MKKDPAAVALGRKGGLARAEALSPKQRSEAASRAARAKTTDQMRKAGKAGAAARWGKKKAKANPNPTG
jgi:hypothetical protein